jgi:hypothetical protein
MNKSNSLHWAWGTLMVLAMCVIAYVVVHFKFTVEELRLKANAK